ncbi:MAG: hypothetical protein ACK6DF_02225, partial [Betaproteobacteria bacterium]
LAGVPGAVIRAARRKLGELEGAASPQGDLFSPPPLPLPPPAAAEHPALDRLRALQPDALSPREALDLLYELQRLASDH